LITDMLIAGGVG